MKSLRITIDFNPIILILFITICFQISAIGQDAKTLESKRKVIEDQISLTNQILNKTKANKQSTLYDYQTIQEQISYRHALINNIKSEVDSARVLVDGNQNEILLLENNIAQIEIKYNQILRTAYRQKLTQNTWLYLLSSKSLKDALLRWRYTKQFETYTKNQIKLLRRTQKELGQAITDITTSQERREKLLDQESHQTNILNSELDRKNNLIKSLERNESLLLSELRKQQQQQESLSAGIEKIIYGSVAPKEDTKVISSEPTSGIKSTLPFSGRKGRVSWPVQGVVTKRFGKQNHPSIAGIKIENNGIDIRTNGPTNVLALHSGVVAGKNFIPGNFNVIVVRHENYLSVYSRLGEVYVNKGDKINEGQSLGKVVDEEGEYIMHLEIWDDKQKLNPMDWLQKK